MSKQKKVILLVLAVLVVVGGGIGFWLWRRSKKVTAPDGTVLTDKDGNKFQFTTTKESWGYQMLINGAYTGAMGVEMGLRNGVLWHVNTGGMEYEYQNGGWVKIK